MINNMDIDSMAKHITCGLHSGIPLCCISFFIFFWNGNIDRPGKLFDMVRKDKNSNYIRCPLCIKRNHIIKVKPCNCGVKNIMQEYIKDFDGDIFVISMIDKRLALEIQKEADSLGLGNAVRRYLELNKIRMNYIFKGIKPTQEHIELFGRITKRIKQKYGINKL
jgi:hypothetical protein